MKISTILDHIDSGFIALPEFQRGYVWSRDQVRALFQSLYRRYPVGGLLTWSTESANVHHRGGDALPRGVVRLLLDGQQRMTSLYGIARGKPPRFFDGDRRAIVGLHFHLEDEVFAFHQPMRMAGDLLWVDVSKLMAEATFLGEHFSKLNSSERHAINGATYIDRLQKVRSIVDIDLHVDDVTGADKSLDVVVEIFNQVNSGGTKLSQGDLALAKVCSNWPEARKKMKTKLSEWKHNGYEFNLIWLLRSINSVLTGEAKFSHIHTKSTDEIQFGMERATKAIDKILNLIGGRLGLDHDRVLIGRSAIPIMVRYMDQRNSMLSQRESDKLLFWYLQAGMWGRFTAGSTETSLDKSLEAIREIDGGLDRLLEDVRIWHGTFRVKPDNFRSSTVGARFYPVLYMLTRIEGSEDWGSGIPLKANLLGKGSKLELHHIFPKSKLYKDKENSYTKADVNALANFCFLTKETNQAIGDRLPEEYFPEIQAQHPNSLASQWIPSDPDLWKIENYRKFLEARINLLAEAMNRLLKKLMHDELHFLDDSSEIVSSQIPTLEGIIADEDDGLLALNDWMVGHGLQPGIVSYGLSDPSTGEETAMLDIAWPVGVQEELTQSVAVLLNGSAEMIAMASSCGYRCFASLDSFKRYIGNEILGDAERI